MRHITGAALLAAVALVSSCSDAATDTRETAAAPTFSPPESLNFGAPLAVELATVTEGAAIHYTTDGSAPTAASEAYAAPIVLAGTTTVKAISVRDGMHDSAVASATYVHRPVSLVLDDGSFEFGTGGAEVAAVFLNRFTPAAEDFPFQLRTVSLFNDAPAGRSIRIAVYTDADGDPSNGVSLAASYDVVANAPWGWSVFELPDPVTFLVPGDVLIGQIATGDMFYFDTTTRQGRCWYGFWMWGAGDPSQLPGLEPELNGAQFMIRGAN